jgi:uroporphyrinogen decarboxylase
MALIDSLVSNVKPAPDYTRLRRALLRQGQPDRVPLLELKADDEVIAEIMGVRDELAASNGKLEMKRWTRLLVNFWYRLGYDAIRLRGGLLLPSLKLTAEDTAGLKRAGRDWQSESEGPISDWASFEKYPWPRAEDADFTQIEYASSILPEGMKLLPSPLGMAEPLMWLMGYQPFALALYDMPDLIQAMTDRISSIFVPIAEALLDMDGVMGLLLADDMGFKTATMIAPDHLRRYVFPHLKKMAALAHAKGKICILHSCGNLEKVMDDLIDDVSIDAKHSFEDVIIPVEQFKARYGERIGVVGGIDVHLLSSADEATVRARTRDVLDACMPGGGYVLGTGNSVTNYIPVRNFLAMLDEGRRWQPST